ncbi:uncharacterized protein [Prorops nasuta]|uniref:uncharacterized protein n=1 Tax=Prorops nasuta TaxID=863751 RepID=UPI0034CF1548
MDMPDKEMDKIRHKCGYCGWLFKLTADFTDHKCFKNYKEEVDRIKIDENHVVTIIEHNPMAIDDNKEHLNELLIEAVRSKRGLYDFRHIPASERTLLRKNALWMEVSNMLRGSLSPSEAKLKWKYLRDNYIKARKKVNSYIPSGSAACANNMSCKPKFQYYELMRFLDDTLQTQPTVSSLTDINENEVVAAPEIQNKCDNIASFSTTPQNSTAAVSKSSFALDCSNGLVQTQKSLKTLPLTSNTNRVPTRLRDTGSKELVQNSFDISEQPVTKKKKNDVALQEALIEAIKSGNEPVEPIDPLDGFLVRLGEGMRRLPYRNRARLEIQYLTLLSEMEDRCFQQDVEDK